MTLIWDLEQFPHSARGGAVSVGNFDGVHCGHAALMQRLVKMAREVSGPAVAVTFDPHPATYLRAGKVPAKLTEIQRRAELLRSCGVDYVIVCRTSTEWLQQTAKQFFDRILVEKANAKGIVEGPNFFFGRNREGSLQTLADFCSQRNMLLDIVSAQESDGEMVSSTQVRQRLLRGDITGANTILTAPYRLTGTVVHGASRGRQLGFPTANLEGIETLVPGLGVYATIATCESESYVAATHIGPNLTFGVDAVKVEAHLLEFNGSLYGRRLSLDFIDRVRDSAKFDSVEALVTQLHQDIEAVKRIAPQDFKS